MFNKIIFLKYFLIISFIGLFSCKKSNLSPNCWGSCENATFYYRGDNCATISGVIVLEDKNESYVTQSRIPKEFRVDSIEVCIKYKNLGSKILTAECEMGEVIKIKCIQNR